MVTEKLFRVQSVNKVKPSIEYACVMTSSVTELDCVQVAVADWKVKASGHEIQFVLSGP